MIYKGDHTLVIPTPTKTATFSLESGFGTDDRFHIIKPRHRHTLPWYVGNTRPIVLMLIRHPYARLFSAWRWMREHGGYKLGRAETFEQFCEEWIKSTRHDWTWRYVDYHRYYWDELGLRDVRLFKLEKDGVHNIHEYCGIACEPRHVNATAKHLPPEKRPSWEDHFTNRCAELVYEYLEPDFKLGGYRVP